MPKTPLTVRMKKTELYVVLLSADKETFDVSFLGYGDRTPRIYSRDAIDPRVWDQSPVCTTLLSAMRASWRGEQCVLVPVSEVADAVEIRRWASSQRDIDPDDVVAYANALCPPSDADSEDTARTKKNVATNQSWWIEQNPEGTLFELLDVLESIQRDFERFDDDSVIADHLDDLMGDSEEYLMMWGNPSEPVCGDELATFGYRHENLEEDLMNVSELIDSLGGEFLVEELTQSTSELAVAS